MFILYAIPIGLVGGFLLGGRLDRLSAIQFRLAPLAIAALLVQLALFSPLADAVPKDVGRAVYVASTGLTFVVLLANLRLTGVPIIALGGLANLVAIVANGGAMPAAPGALAAVGFGVGGNTNSIIVAAPQLAPLTDVFATPAWLPYANVLSLGDILIAVGVAVAIAAAMRAPSRS
jgi:hypothetical protein